MGILPVFYDTFMCSMEILIYALNDNERKTLDLSALMLFDGRIIPALREIVATACMPTCNNI
jgi:hypothetical protein